MGELVSIKGTRNGLVILFDPTREFDEIKRNLLNKMESAKGFFNGAKFTFYQDNMIKNHQHELEAICSQYGLVHAPEIKMALKEKTTETKTKTPAVTNVAQDPESKYIQNKQTGETLMVKRGLRSGQKIYYPGHIVILGDIHSGAEVAADGDVIIMGSCRGIIHAGARGNLKAKVVAFRLCPSQLRIAHTIACSPPGDQWAGYPESARIEENQIVIERYGNSKMHI